MSVELGQYDGDAVVVQNGTRLGVRCRYRIEADTIDIGEDEEVPGLKRWTGTIESDELDIGAATLELADGTIGEIIIRPSIVDVTAYGSAWIRTLMGANGEFVGSGPAPGWAER